MVPKLTKSNLAKAISGLTRLVGWCMGCDGNYIKSPAHPSGNQINYDN
jgi:hypothetical protein